MNTKLIEKFARQFYKADHSIIQFDDNEVYLSNGDFIFKMPYKDYEIFREDYLAAKEKRHERHSV